MKILRFALISIALLSVLALASFAQVPHTVGFGINAYNSSLGDRVNGTHSTEINIYKLTNGAQSGSPLANVSETINYFQGVSNIHMTSTGYYWPDSYCFTTRVGGGTESSCGNITPHLQALFSNVSFVANYSRNSTFSVQAANASFCAGVNWNDVTNQPTINASSTTDELQNIWETVDADSGSTTASTQTDTLTIAGGENVTTSISGDTLTINVVMSQVDWSIIQNGNVNVTFRNITGTGLRLDADGDYGASTSVGGAINLDNTDNVGAGIIVYSNQDASASGRLLNLRADNPAFDQAALHVDYDGVQNAVEIVCTGQDSSQQCLNVVSHNFLDTTLGINSNTTARGAIKVTHGGDRSSSSASALSIAMQSNGSGPNAATGVFIKFENSTNDADFIFLKDQDTDKVRIKRNGDINTSGKFNGSQVITKGIFATSLTLRSQATTNDFFTGSALDLSSLFRFTETAGGAFLANFRNAAGQNVWEIRTDGAKNIIGAGRLNVTAGINTTNITMPAFKNCAIETDGTGRFQCGVDDTSGGGAGSAPDDGYFVLNDSFIVLNVSVRSDFHVPDDLNVSGDVQANHINATGNTNVNNFWANIAFLNRTTFQSQSVSSRSVELRASDATLIWGLQETAGGDGWWELFDTSGVRKHKISGDGGDNYFTDAQLVITDGTETSANNTLHLYGQQMIQNGTSSSLTYVNASGCHIILGATSKLSIC